VVVLLFDPVRSGEGSVFMLTILDPLTAEPKQAGGSLAKSGDYTQNACRLNCEGNRDFSQLTIKVGRAGRYG
jgi:hypothetical protein